MMTVGEIMTKNVVTVDMDDTLRTISQIFHAHRFHHLLVTKEKKLVGIISDRDFIKAMSPFLHSLSEREQDRATLNTKAHRIMTRNPLTATQETSIEQASKLLVKNNISCLPVIDAGGEIEGIVTWKDILNWSIFFRI